MIIHMIDSLMARYETLLIAVNRITIFENFNRNDSTLLILEFSA